MFARPARLGAVAISVTARQASVVGSVDCLPLQYGRTHYDAVMHRPSGAPQAKKRSPGIPSSRLSIRLLGTPS